MINIEKQIEDIQYMIKCDKLVQAQLMLDCLRIVLIARGFSNA